MVQTQNSMLKDMKLFENIQKIKINKRTDHQEIITKKISIIIPALNEEHTIKKLILDIDKELKHELSLNDFEIIVIDDGSDDETYKKASELNLAKIYKNYRNMGKGYSMRKGLNYSVGRYIAFIDADGSHSVKDLIRGLKIIEKIEKNNENEKPFLITGVRFKNGKSGTTLLNKLGNRLYTLIGLVLWNKNINDLTCGLRLARKSDLVELGLSSFKYTIEVEMIALSLRKKYNIIQMSINARQRMFGSSGVRVLKEGIIIPISFVLASTETFSWITRKIAI